MGHVGSESSSEPGAQEDSRAAGCEDTLAMIERAPWNEPVDPLAGVVEHAVLER